jgi:hypothetical protein
MINIYAQAFMTATRTDCIRVRDVPAVPHKKWFSWFSRRKTRCIDLAKL